MNDTLTHRYFPAFSTREAEAKAYAMLDGNAKDRLLPIVMLTRMPYATSLQPSLDSILQSAGGRRLIIDFDVTLKDVPTDSEFYKKIKERDDARKKENKNPTSDKQKAYWDRLRNGTISYNSFIKEISSPENGYSSWRQFSLSSSNLIPLIRPSADGQMVIMAKEIISIGRRVAFLLDVNNDDSIKAFMALLPYLGSRADLSIVIFDAGHIRGSVDAATRLVTRALSTVRDASPDQFNHMIKICLAGSFPSSLENLVSPLRIQERDLFDRVCALDWNVRYGDYASIQPRSAQAGGNGWLPHVEVARDREWHFSRSDKNSDDQGYIECARSLVENDIVWGNRVSSWGTDMVKMASKGKLIDGNYKLTTPGPWIGVRMSQHLTCQASVL